MKKNSRILIVLLVAVIFAVAAGVCIYQFLSPQRTTIYVFNKSYDAGTTLTAGMLTPIQVDSSIVIAGAKAPVGQRFVTSKEFSALLKTGDSLKSRVSEGTPLMLSLLSVTGGNAIEMSMQSTAVAVTIEVTSTTGITNDLEPGTTTNVYVTYHSGGTKLLFEKMRILAVHKSGSGGGLSGVTLETSNDEALRLIDATHNGSLYLGLVNVGGYQPDDETKGSSGEKSTNSNIDDALSKPNGSSPETPTN